MEFSEQKLKFDTEFGEVYNVSDGGYERGYSAGYETGHTEGYEQGETDGYVKGEADGYDRGHTDGYSVGYNDGYNVGYGDASAGLPTYETEITYTSSVASVAITHNLNSQKLLVIGRVKEHDGTDFVASRISQIVAWTPQAFFQNAVYNLANGGTYNPYQYWVEGNRSTGAYIRYVAAGSTSATYPSCVESSRQGSAAFPANDGKKVTIAPNGYLLPKSTWHFTVVDVSSIM